MAPHDGDHLILVVTNNRTLYMFKANTDEPAALLWQMPIDQDDGMSELTDLQLIAPPDDRALIVCTKLLCKYGGGGEADRLRSYWYKFHPSSKIPKNLTILKNPISVRVGQQFSSRF